MQPRGVKGSHPTHSTNREESQVQKKNFHRRTHKIGPVLSLIEGSKHKSYSRIIENRIPKVSHDQIFENLLCYTKFGFHPLG